MSVNMLDVVIPAIVGVVTAVTTFLASRSSNKKDLTINDRQLLSEDEKQFRIELRETIVSYKADMELAQKEIRALRNEVASLHKINLELTIENKQLQTKVDSLHDELRSMRGD